ncbi:alpha/beta hydrolase [Nonomuraea sp. NPDC050556]|uniref:alpha/beta hydrolase n=1 Tax=Nonomuraea sp. NPDC050556 TaxID=3364369 RepID=UPI0037A0936D
MEASSGAAASVAALALARVATLAAAHHADLDGAARLMHAHAWVGGGAPAFASDLGGRRVALQAAFSGALASLADLVVRQGGQVAPLPSFGTSVAAIGPAPSGYQGISPEAMAALISALSDAGAVLPSVGSRLAAELSGVGLSADFGQSVGAIGVWAGAQAPDLRRRLALVRREAPDVLPAGVVAYTLFGGYIQLEELLRRLSAGDSSAVAALLAVQEGDPTLAGRINAWWRASPQDELLDVPGFGLLNGLPAVVRDRANRRSLALEKARLAAAISAATTTLQPSDLGHWELLSNQLRRAEMIERELQPMPGHPVPLLLSYSLDGLGRLVVSWGDPDTADITVTSVSGLTSGLDAAHGDLQRARALWQQSTATSGDRAVASITWLGYDAPQLDPGVLVPATSVAFSQAAARGGGALAGFVDGLRAAHEPSGTARSVVIGHSYGSLTVGHAARLRPGRLADDLVFIGSPGVGVGYASELGVRGGHVWVGEAGGDPVAALGRFGTDPGHASFGANHFPVGRDVFTSAHSSYWDQDSVSLTNMGHIINGHYDKLIRPQPLDDRPQLLLPQVATPPKR